MTLPTDSLYEDGIPVELERTGSDYTVSTRSALAEQIDWQTPAATTEETRAVTRQVATIRHYGSTSQLLLCDQLWQQEHAAPVRSIIRTVARHTADEMTVWGKYLVRIDGGSTIPDKLHELYQSLFAEDDPVAVLLGMTTANMLARQGLRELRAEGDALFNAIATTLADDLASVSSDLVAPYRQVVNTRAAQERRALLATVAAYIDRAGAIARQDSIDFPAEAWDAEQRWQHVGEPVKQFYREIGVAHDIARR